MSDEVPMTDDAIRRGLSERLVLFRAIDRATGQVITVDQRTFDDEVHDALDPIPPEGSYYARH